MNNNCDIDNIGGLFDPQFILKSDLLYFGVAENICFIELHSGRSWKPLKIKKEGMTLSLVQAKDTAGRINTISGSLTLLKSCEYIDLLRLADYILIQYTDGDGVIRVLGTDDYPLEITIQPITPSSPSGFKGYQVNFAGKQLIEPPVLKS